jgi:hypothetical protein
MDNNASQDAGSLDGALVARSPGRLTSLIFLALVVANYATADGALERRLKGCREIALLILAGFVVALIISKDMRNDTFAFLRRRRAAAQTFTKSSRGRVRVLAPVRHARTAEPVGAYFFATPSPRERWWTDLFDVLFWRYTKYVSPQDVISSGIGKLEVELDSGEVARIDTDAFEPSGWRFTKGFRRLDFVLSDGDRIELSGDCAWDQSAHLPTLSFTSTQKRLKLRVLS